MKKVIIHKIIIRKIFLFLIWLRRMSNSKQELTAVFQQVIRSCRLYRRSDGGELRKRVCRRFASTDRAVAVNSGTDALRFALMAAGVKPGDVVVTVPHTFIATTEAISQAGALPEFVDIDERTYNMDPDKLRDVSRNSVHVSEDGS